MAASAQRKQSGSREQLGVMENELMHINSSLERIDAQLGKLDEKVGKLNIFVFGGGLIGIVGIAKLFGALGGGVVVTPVQDVSATTTPPNVQQVIHDTANSTAEATVRQLIHEFERIRQVDEGQGQAEDIPSSQGQP